MEQPDYNLLSAGLAPDNPVRNPTTFTKNRSRQPQRNVVLIMLESTRFGATSLCAPFYETTPAMKWMADGGALVDHIYAAARIIPYVCILSALHLA